jgi:hypothetical protein
VEVEAFNRFGEKLQVKHYRHNLPENSQFCGNDRQSVLMRPTERRKNQQRSGTIRRLEA